MVRAVSRHWSDIEIAAWCVCGDSESWQSRDVKERAEDQDLAYASLDVLYLKSDETWRLIGDNVAFRYNDLHEGDMQAASAALGEAGENCSIDYHASLYCHV